MLSGVSAIPSFLAESASAVLTYVYNTVTDETTEDVQCAHAAYIIY